ncbi:MAG: Tn3 family transposase, partial [Actinobacteria bacterium]|nr:Tn3 family transposase [Actinomycetota bacterium]
MLRERGDELIDRYCSAIQNAERTAINAVKKQREETARARDQRSSLAGTLARILLDAIENGEDPVSRTLREVGEQRLRDAVADPGALAVPIEQERRDAQHRRHAHLAQFAPAVIAALDLTASRGYERLLAAVEDANANRHLRLLPDAQLPVLPAAWRAWTLDEQGRPVRTRYELALWILVRDALRARGLYRARSHRYGDPAGWMMPRVQWQRERTELAAIFDRPLDGQARLAELEASQRQLVRRLQAGLDGRERVLFDGDRIIGEPASEQRVEKPALAGVVHDMLPLVEISSLVIETHHDIGFLDELQHRGGSVARSSARLGQLVAVLLADATGIGFARMAHASGFTEKELRDAAARHYSPENLAAANTRVLERLRLLPHRWILDEQLTSSDGQRFETIGKSPIAGYAARYAGYRKRMLTWLLWLTGQYGHFGGKVIPVTERESWHTLDALVGLDTPTVQHTSDTHGATERVSAIFD